MESITSCFQDSVKNSHLTNELNKTVKTESSFLNKENKLRIFPYRLDLPTAHIVE